MLNYSFTYLYQNEKNQKTRKITKNYIFYIQLAKSLNLSTYYSPNTFLKVLLLINKKEKERKKKKRTNLNTLYCSYFFRY
jgi:hypothetical protein